MNKIKEMDSQLFFIIISVIITGVLAIKAHLSDNKKENELKNKTQKIINLQQELNESYEKLIIEQRENKIISEDILKVQGKLDSNTIAIRKVADEISKVSMETNQISNAIKNEQKEKGKLNLKVGEYDEYRFNIGSNIFVLNREILENGFDFESRGPVSIPLTMRIIGNDLLIETILRDKNDNLIVRIFDNEWSLNKNYTYSINFDEFGLEVIDNEGLIVLQISLVKDSFQIMMLVYDLGKITMVNSKGIYSTFLFEKGNNAKDFQQYIQPHKELSNTLFKHYGEDYLGKRLK